MSEGNGTDLEPVETAITRVIAEVAVVPKDMISAATEQAQALAALIEKHKLYSNIKGKKYVRVEGWVPLARMNGVIPKEISNQQQPDGSYIARVQLIRTTDGAVLTEASGECGGPEEPLWNERAPYARRSMAATRATGKACRLAYSWIIALSGYEPTPAEEIPHEDEKPKEKKAFNKGIPDTYWTFTKDGNRVIGVIEGPKFTNDIIEALGFKAGTKKDGKWFAPYHQEIIVTLEKAGIESQNPHPYER